MRSCCETCGPPPRATWIDALKTMMHKEVLHTMATTTTERTFRLEDHPGLADALKKLEGLRAKLASAETDRDRLAGEAQTTEQAAIDQEIKEIAKEAAAGSARPAWQKVEDAKRRGEAARVYVERLQQAVTQQEAEVAEQRSAAQERMRQLVRQAHEQVIVRMAKALRELAATEAEEQELRDAAVRVLGGPAGTLGVSIYPPDEATLGDLGLEGDPHSGITRWLKVLRQNGYPV